MELMQRLQSMDPKLLKGLAVGLVLIGAFLFWRFRGRDPLPVPDPKCVWHSTVKSVESVYDGDTFKAHIKGHNPIDGKSVGIRIRGIDTPELRDSRPGVRKKAQKAKEFTEAKIKNARRIDLYNISTADKYGRILATVFCDRRDLGRMLVKQGLAKSYDGGKKPKWR